MSEEYVEKKIVVNDKIINLKILKELNNEKIELIMFEFKNLIFEMKHRKMELSFFKQEDFDFITIMLIVKHCTSFLNKDQNSILEVTRNYASLLKNNTLKFISDALMESHLFPQIEQILLNCTSILKKEVYDVNVINYLKMFTDKIKKQQNNNFLLSKNQRVTLSKKKKEVEKVNKEKQFEPLLEQYNDAKFLYDFFGDTKYKNKMNRILKKMKDKWKELYDEK
jgi:hypothetical protein